MFQADCTSGYPPSPTTCTTTPPPPPTASTGADVGMPVAAAGSLLLIGTVALVAARRRLSR